MSEALAVFGYCSTRYIITFGYKGLGKSLIGEWRMFVLRRYDLVESLEYLMRRHIIVGVRTLVEKQFERIQAVRRKYIFA